MLAPSHRLGQLHGNQRGEVPFYDLDDEAIGLLLQETPRKQAPMNEVCPFEWLRHNRRHGGGVGVAAHEQSTRPKVIYIANSAEERSLCREESSQWNRSREPRIAK